MKKTTVSANNCFRCNSLERFCADQKSPWSTWKNFSRTTIRRKFQTPTSKNRPKSSRIIPTKLNDSLLKLQDEFKEVRDASQNIALSEAERRKQENAAQDKYRQLKEKENEVKQYNSEKQKPAQGQIRGAEKQSPEGNSPKTIRKLLPAPGNHARPRLSGKTLNNIPSVIYRVPELDITDAILKEINKPVEDKKAPEERKKEDTKSDKK